MSSCAYKLVARQKAGRFVLRDYSLRYNITSRLITMIQRAPASDGWARKALRFWTDEGRCKRVCLCGCEQNGQHKSPLGCRAGGGGVFHRGSGLGPVHEDWTLHVSDLQRFCRPHTSRFFIGQPQVSVIPHISFDSSLTILFVGLCMCTERVLSKWHLKWYWKNLSTCIYIYVCVYTH